LLIEGLNVEAAKTAVITRESEVVELKNVEVPTFLNDDSEKGESLEPG
jgi:hypothetical protein